MYYYKQLNENGEVIGLISCETFLLSDDTQIQITLEEYEEIANSIPSPTEEI